MESVIGEHFSLIGNFQSLDLIFDVEPPFVKANEGILFFDKIFFDKNNFIEGIIQNREKEGFWIFWWENGQKAEEGHYHNGEREGIWIYWYKNGQKWMEGYYHNGKEEGLWIFWYKNGQKKAENYYRNERREGLCKYWDEMGEELENLF